MCLLWMEQSCNVKKVSFIKILVSGHDLVKGHGSLIKDFILWPTGKEIFMHFLIYPIANQNDSVHSSEDETDLQDVLTHTGTCRHLVHRPGSESRCNI